MLIDSLRLPPLRLFGYGFALGEAMRYNFSFRSVDLAYNIGTGFVIIHILHSTIVGSQHNTWAALLNLADTACWEALASCIIPTVCNAYICRFFADLLWDSDGVPSVAKRWAPCLVGVVMLPLYLLYVDPIVARLLRPLFHHSIAVYYID